MAGLYIFLSLFTAVLFILTRECRISVIKRDHFTIRTDLTFFAITLYNKEKKKSKSDKKGSKAELRRKIYKRITTLLSHSKVELKRIAIPIFPDPSLPSELPFISANRAFSYILVGYLSGIAKEVTLSQDTDDSDSVYHLVIRTPLINLIYLIIALRLDIIKDKRKKRIAYVGKQNG